jgi:chemotaxis protein histidine kinase CheA
MSEDAFQRQLRRVALERIGRIRARLERGFDAKARAEALREAHTLKGEARITGRSDVAELAHELEEWLASEASEAAESAVAERLVRLEELAGGALLAEERGAGSGGRAPDLEHTLLRVELAQVAELTRACSELRAVQRESGDLARELSELASAAVAIDREAVAGRLRSLAARARELTFEQDQRTRTLEDDLRQIRMLPLDRLFAHLRHAAERAAEELGKPVEVFTAGEAIAVDRQVLDAVSEPLLHLVRNAVDHGIEPGDVRAAAGKPTAGRIGLAAEQVGRAIHLTVEEDGRGLDLERVRNALVARGLASAEEARSATRNELLGRIFEPGFTTRREVSELSGRGFGLDIVRRRTESIGGSVSVTSEPGQGTCFVLTVPVSMVADPVVAVEVDDVVHAFATSEVDAMRDFSSVSVGRAGDGDVVRIGEDLVPLRDLGELLGGPPASRRRSLVVLAVAEERLALAVDRVLPVASAVRHGLDPFLQGIDVVRGTVSVAGRLAALLDGRELVRASRSRAVARARPERARGRALRVLVADDSELTRDVLVATLRGLGCEVREAVDGSRALEVLGEGAVDLVLTDLDMPVVDGFELIRRIRADESTRRLPVIVLTTRGAPEDLQRASRLGADAYLTKTSFRAAELAALIERHAQRGE